MATFISKSKIGRTHILGTDGVVVDQRCTSVQTSRQSANQILSYCAAFTPYNGKTPTIFLLNVTHDGCRCKISSFLLINYTGMIKKWRTPEIAIRFRSLPAKKADLS
mgnify:CR=1 FL=1